MSKSTKGVVSLGIGILAIAAGGAAAMSALQARRHLIRKVQPEDEGKWLSYRDVSGVRQTERKVTRRLHSPHEDQNRSTTLPGILLYGPIPAHRPAHHDGGASASTPAAHGTAAAHGAASASSSSSSSTSACSSSSSGAEGKAPVVTTVVTGPNEAHMITTKTCVNRHHHGSCAPSTVGQDVGATETEVIRDSQWLATPRRVQCYNSERDTCAAGWSTFAAIFGTVAVYAGIVSTVGRH
jgi:hypothetical protein